MAKVRAHKAQPVNTEEVVVCPSCDRAAEVECVAKLEKGKPAELALEEGGLKADPTHDLFECGYCGAEFSRCQAA